MADEGENKTESVEVPVTLPAIASLHERHPGLTRACAGTFAEAASVCFGRHYTPPTQLSVTVPDKETATLRILPWNMPDSRVAAAHGNRDDATRDGAYGVSLAALEVEAGLVALGRSEVRTGADYLVGPIGQPAEDYEHAFRLEVSGSSDGDGGTIATRVKKKVKQAAAARSDAPALVAVVGFQERLVVIAQVASDGAPGTTK